MSLGARVRKAPAVVASVFVLGVAAGIGWKFGWIPLEYGPPASGTVEDAESSAADDASAAAGEPLARDADFAFEAEQNEPPVEEGVNLRPLPGDPSETAEPPREEPPLLRAEKPQDRPARNADRVRPVVYQEEPDGELAAPAQPPTETDRFAEVDARLAEGHVLAAHKLLSKMYWNSTEPDADLRERLDATARKIFFAPQPHFIDPYVVQPGDQLRKIAAKYQLSWEYLASLNKTDPKRIRAGQKLKVLKGPFAAVVSLRDYSLTVHLQGYYVRRYDVGIGKDGTSPIGKFAVLEKIENPQYTDPDGKVIEGDDPANPLGERWIGLGDSYGIHGTIDPESIGKAESRGCIRLRDADIIEVYNFLVVGSVVEIRE